MEKPCISCHRLDHFIGECPYINPTFQNQNIISQFRTDSVNERRRFHRKERKGHNARNFMKEILEKTKNHNFENFMVLNSAGNFQNNKKQNPKISFFILL